MKTHPDLPFSEHIRHWLEFQREYFPKLDEDMLLFCDEEDIFQSEMGAALEKKKLMDMREFQIFFEKLCSEGREWINLGGDSWYGKKYVVSVEYSKRLDFPMTSIVHSGPTLDGTRRAITKTRLKISE